MDVLQEILAWSDTRPTWQRDALRRLALTGTLDDTDIQDLVEICKASHGLADAQVPNPLTSEHLPDSASVAGQVNVQSIYHHCGVNALADKQTVAFGPGLTVVYGDNAAGKSGYTRILKSACRTRGAEDILGNVLSGSAPPNATVSIKYTVGDNGTVHEWVGEGSDDSITRVTVFDSHSATVYLTEKTDVAFRPFGLDLFDKLAQACKAVRVRLEQEQKALGTGGLNLDIAEGTAAAKLVASISSLTVPDAVKSLANVSDEDHARTKLLEKKLVDLQTQNPEKAALELTLRAGRLRSILKQLTAIDSALSGEVVMTVFDAQSDTQQASNIAKKLREETFPANLLQETGSESWAVMWEAARQFSETGAYPDHKFPFTENDARCVLCQQDLDDFSTERLQQFEAFTISVAEKKYRDARNKYAQLYKNLSELAIGTEVVDDATKEIRIEAADLAGDLVASLQGAEARRSDILSGLQEKTGLPAKLTEYESVVAKVEALAKQLDERVAALQKQKGAGGGDNVSAELQELRARVRLGKFESKVLAEIERKKKIAAYGLCLNDTRTQGITAKSTSVTKVVVTSKLKSSFQEELKKLKFGHVEVELKEVGGDLGNLFHKLLLTRAPGVELPRVVSEGEQRCLSIAAFFAELSTADDPSAILFDDPVSSLDYKWRDSVAQRLVGEAKARQVMVFTHDIVFLLLLKQYAKEQCIDMVDQHVKQVRAIGAGICAPELPWVAMPVKKRIGFLKNAWQTADKLFRDGEQATYEKEAILIYGWLREAWERGVEEVLLNGIIERYRVGVQTQQIAVIADITSQDCQGVDSAMTKCSKWLAGHDQAAGAKADIPEPDELMEDVEALASWVKTINARR